MTADGEKASADLRTSTVAVEAVIDASTVGRYQLRVFAITIAVFIVDGFDLQIISYILPEISDAWGVSTRMQGVILSSGLAGLMAGYLLLPLLAARLGLRRVVIGSLAAMSVTSLLSAMSPGVTIFVILRFLTGLTLGGVFPNMMALATEYCPRRLRATLVSIAFVGLPIGFLFAGWSVWLIQPIAGWRGAMMLGGVLPLFAIALVWFACPESPEYLVNRGRNGDARARRALSRIASSIRIGPHVRLIAGSAYAARVSVGDLFRQQRAIGTVALWTGLVTNSIVYYFVLSWTPLILVRIGAEQGDAILAASLANIGGIIAAFVMGPLMDRLDAYRTVIAIFLVGAISCILVGTVLSPDLRIIVPAALCLGFCISALQKGVAALAMRFYPAELRAIGLGWTFGVGRIGAILGPMLAGLLLAASWTPASIYYLMALPMLVGGAAIAIMIRYHADGAATAGD